MDDDDEKWLAEIGPLIQRLLNESVRFSEVGRVSRHIFYILIIIFGININTVSIWSRSRASVSSTTPRDANGDEISSESGLEEARVQGERVANRTEVPSTTGQFDDAEEDR
ncbi:hypothetical protein BASA83_003161 [Batrachochytrium salamandrivorans]|nr:hypothetical protein BASA83_003161 [Batrachochytrium salamandrivorans]